MGKMTGFVAIALTMRLVGSAWAQQPPSSPPLPPLPRHITVRGSAVTRARPDAAVWNITYRVHGKTVRDLQRDAARQLQALMQIADQLHIKKADRQTGVLVVQPRGDGAPVGLQRTVILRQGDLGDVAALMGKLSGHSDWQFVYHLEVTNLRQVRRRTLLAAETVARDKAQALAAALGTKLGKVLDIEELTPCVSHGKPGQRHRRRGEAQPTPTGADGVSIPVRETLSVMFALK